MLHYILKVSAMRDKRSRHEIIVEILEVAIGGANVTKIVYRANINFKMARSYLTYLVKYGFIEILAENGKNVYKTTDKGRTFIKKYKELEGLHY